MLSQKINIISRNKIEDSRGWFLKTLTGKENHLSMQIGEIYLTVAKPGAAKGAHYHNQAQEWFTLLHGECILKLVDIDTKEEMSLHLSDSLHQTIHIPVKVAHIFINIGAEDFSLLAYSDMLYDPSDTIPFPFL